MALQDQDTILPERLADVWDDGVSSSFGKLSFNEQTFVLDYLTHGIGARAYLKAYPNASKEGAPAYASRLIRTDRVKAFLDEFRESSVEDFFLVHRRLKSIISGEVLEVEYNGEKIPLIPTVKDINTASATFAKLAGINPVETVNVDASEQLRGFLSKLKGSE